MARAPRRARHARLTETADTAWERLITRRGVTFTGLLEALGELLDQDVDWVPDRAIERARQIDRQRHSRR